MFEKTFGHEPTNVKGKMRLGFFLVDFYTDIYMCVIRQGWRGGDNAGGREVHIIMSICCMFILIHED